METETHLTLDFTAESSDPCCLIEEKIIGHSSDDFTKSTLVSPDGSFLLSYSDSSKVYLDYINTDLIQQHSYYPTSFSYNHAEDSMAACSIDIDADSLTTDSLQQASGTSAASCPSQTPCTPAILPYHVFSTGETIYDCKWFPQFSLADPSTTCFAISQRDHPIHLWDISGYIRCSYRGHNHLDEFDPAVSIAFNLSGDKIYSGSTRTIKLVPHLLLLS